MTLRRQRPPTNILERVFDLTFSALFTRSCSEMSSQSFMAAQAEGLCLRHPEDFPPNVVTIQTAVQLLRGSLKVASETAFVWGYLDQPRGVFYMLCPYYLLVQHVAQTPQYISYFYHKARRIRKMESGGLPREIFCSAYH